MERKKKNNNFNFSYLFNSPCLVWLHTGKTAKQAKIYQQKATWEHVTVRRSPMTCFSQDSVFVFFRDMSQYSKWTSRICIFSQLWRSFGQYVEQRRSSKTAPLRALQGNVSWTMCSLHVVQRRHAAGCGGWFTPTVRNACRTWVGWRSDCVHTINGLHQSSLVAILMPRLHGVSY